jgi:hypothetical protein
MRQVEAISIKTAPLKATYTEGETFNPAGLIIMAHYNNGKSETISEYAIDKTILSQDDTLITVTYQGKTVTFPVTVNAKSISSISIKSQPSKLSYIEGEDLNLNSAVLHVEYNNNTTADVVVTSTMCSGYSADTTGSQIVTVTYQGKTTTFPVTVNAKSIKSISMKFQPSKLTYIEGEGLNLSGAVISVAYNNNTTADVVMTSAMCSGYSADTIGSQTVTVTYQGKTTTFPVTVIAKSISTISMKSQPTKLIYIEGESLNLNGAVLSVAYNNNTTADVAVISAMCSGYSADTTGSQTVTVTYQGKTTTFPVTVISKSISSISMKTQPSKLTYIEGESLNLIGAVLSVSYNNNTTDDVAVTSAMCSGYNTETIGSQPVTVTYQGKTTTFPVTVLAKSVSSISMKSQPTKLIYIEGEGLNLSGAVLSVAYNNNTTADVAVTSTMCSGYSADKIGVQTVTVTYKNKVTAFTITTISNISELSSPKIPQEKVQENVQVSQIKTTQTVFALVNGKSLVIPAVAYTSDNSIAKLIYSSSDESIATISSQGKITAKRTGTAKVTISAENGKKTIVTIKVVKKAIAVKKVSVIKPPKLIKKGKSKFLKVKLSPTNPTGVVVKFKSNKPSVLSVDKAGKVTAKKKGTAKVTITAGGKKATIKIKVK